MNITQLKKEIIRSIKINKDSIILNEKIDKRTVELLKFDYDDLTRFVLKCFKEHTKGVWYEMHKTRTRNKRLFN